MAASSSAGQALHKRREAARAATATGGLSIHATETAPTATSTTSASGAAAAQPSAVAAVTASGSSSGAAAVTVAASASGAAPQVSRYGSVNSSDRVPRGAGAAGGVGSAGVGARAVPLQRSAREADGGDAERQPLLFSGRPRRLDGTRTTSSHLNSFVWALQCSSIPFCVCVVALCYVQMGCGLTFVRHCLRRVCCARAAACAV